MKTFCDYCFQKIRLQMTVCKKFDQSQSSVIQILKKKYKWKQISLNDSLCNLLNQQKLNSYLNINGKIGIYKKLIQKHQFKWQNQENQFLNFFAYTECIEESISNRIQVANLCPCKSGYGEFAIREAQCGKCHPKCETCFQAADDTDNQYCLTCIPGQNREVSDNFNCDCKENYGDFGVLEVCALCHYTCGACNGVEATNCIQCSISSSRELTTLGECLCKQSYYDDNTGNIVCQRCHNSCVTCANSIEKDACLECPSSRTSVLSGSYFECVCTAPNTFDDGSSLECQQCDQTCQTCYGSLSSNCLTCDKLYRYYQCLKISGFFSSK